MNINVKDPKFLRWVGAVLLVAVVVPMYFMSDSYSITYKSRTKVIVELDAHHQKLAGDLERARLLVRNLERVEQEYAILSDQWEVAQTLLPEENEMPDLLRKVTAAGQQSGVDFELFRPQAAVNQGFYSDNPIEVRVASGYHQAGVFLSRLANLNRIVNVSDLRMEGVVDQSESPHTIVMAMTLTAYTQGSANAPAPATNADGTPNTLSADNGGVQMKTAQANASH
ncbi:MAG: type IV pilus assembly protein PilO [Candidatus Krumholzibacteriia bacterium]|jgi:type IV pilus assembly protein PilO